MRRNSSESDARISLPIVPMLDMTFQLLFFAIMNFHPADYEGQMDMSLPADADTQVSRQEDVKEKSKSDPKAELEFPSDLTVKVRTQLDGVTDGEISAIFVRNLEGKEEPVDLLPGLERYLREKRETLTNKDELKLQSDGKLKVRGLMKVMDVCRQAGFKKVNLVPPGG